MKLENNLCSVCISKNSQFTLFSTDNKHYDVICYLDNFTRNNHVCAYEVNIKTRDEATRTIALIGRPFGSIGHCAVLAGSRLTILVDEWLAFLDLASLEISKKIEILSMGTGIALHNFADGFLVHGEIEVVKVDWQGNFIWSFAARDIWVTSDGSEALVIDGDKILLKDFNNDTYVLDRNGKVIDI